jgi:hypothetical protein
MLASKALTLPSRTPFSGAGWIGGAPLITRSSSSTSAIASAIGPAVSRVCEIGTMPCCG